MASKIARKQFKDINHDLNFLKMYQARALATDRTLGAHPIKQPLDNLNQASLLYDNIIYDKAPVVMRKLEEQTGPEHFQVGLRKYLRRYAYRNASWDDLIQLLDKENPDASLKEFSRAWVEDKGMPLIRVEADDHGLTITQEDPEKQNLLCPQHFDLLPGFEMTRNRLVTVNMNAKSVRVPLQMKPDFIIPNYSGSGYGRFLLDEHYNYLLTKRLLSTSNDLTRYAIAQTLYENYLNGQYDHCYFSETNPLVATSLCTQLHQFVIDRERGQRLRLEPFLLDVARETTVPSCRQTLLRLLATDAITPEVTDYLYTLWQRQDDPLLQERDYIQLSYYLAIMRPAHWKEIIDTQRGRLKNADLIREYEFVSRACNPSVEEQRKLFRSLLNKENREVEPWAQAMLRLLSCRAREPQNNEYITPGLEVLEEIQQTGDVFFPANWLQALLSQHKSREARQLVVQFLDRHPNYPSTLRNKILEAAYDMMRIEE
jgi:aminopeptidase N